MNKIFMTKRGHDGKVVVCSEKTRARGKMKALVTATALATGMMGLATTANAEEMELLTSNDIRWQAVVQAISSAEGSWQF